MIDQELLQQAVETAQHGIYVTDPGGRILFANAAFAEITGYTPAELAGARMSILATGDTPREYYARLWSTIAAGETWREQIENRRKDGSRYTAFQVITPVRGDDGTIRAYVGVQHDITAEREMRRALEAAVVECDAIFTYTLDALFLVDVHDGGARFTYRRLSRSHELLTGFSNDAVRHRSPEEVLGPEQGAAIVGHLRHCMQVGQPVSYEETLHVPAGVQVWHTQLAPVISHGAIVQIVGSARDITERKRMEDDLRYLSEIDTLTGIPNRRKITDELDRELGRAQRHGNALSILMVDIDHFKSINDELGHESGDTALRGIASIIQASLRPSDRVGRWGGEEFIIILPQTDHPGARTAAERVRRAAEQSQCIPGRRITVSVGVASLGPIRSANPRALAHTVDSLVRVADEELYRAKDLGRNRTSG